MIFCPRRRTILAGNLRRAKSSWLAVHSLLTEGPLEIQREQKFPCAQEEILIKQ